jgi:hypothetical protein
MNDKLVKAAVDQFLRHVSFTARSEIEKVVHAALANGKLSGQDSVNAAVALSSEQIGLNVTIYSKITL